MQFSVTPSYRDLFKEEAPDIDSLISDIPSRVVIGFISAINADLFFKENEIETQRKIFSFWSQRFSEREKKVIFNGIFPFLQSNNPPTFFALWYSMEFIQRELVNYRDFDLDDTTPEQEFRLLKAYFVIVEQCNDSHVKFFKERPKKEVIGEFHFQEVTWPMLAGQFDFNNKIEPTYQFAKTMVLLKYLFEQPTTTKYVQNFLNVVKRDSVLHYISDLLSFINSTLSHDETKPFKNFSFFAQPEFAIIFDNWCIDRLELVNDENKRMDYKGLRERPLFKMPDGKYMVMNWSFLYNQLNLGLLFAFYKVSGISEIYKDFPVFRSHVSKEVSEDIIFSGVIKKALDKKHTMTISSAAQQNDFPDCYHREQKNIFLFEFKDVLMPVKAIGSCNYETIKSDIDMKFIESKDGKKGIRQVLQQIIKLNENKLDVDDFESRGIKKRNVVIYPVIIYTHFMYSMPGINTYLNSIFRRELEEYNKRNKIQFSQVKDIVMIDFEFLYRNFLLLKNGELKLKELLDSYIEWIKKAKVKANKEQTTENVIKANSSFEEFKFRINSNYGKSGYVNELFDALGIVV